MAGYIKVYRTLFDNPVICKDNDYLALWLYLLCEATHKNKDVMFKGKRYTLKAGELTTGRKRISDKLHISESKVQRILKTFETEQQIEQRTDRQCRLISIVNWNEYQCSEQPNEQPVNNERTTSEQRVNTKQECNNEKMKESCIIPPTMEMVVAYCKEKNNGIDGEYFWNYYESKGWLVGKTKMKNWHSSIATWVKNKNTNQTNQKPIVTPKDKWDEVERKGELK